MKRLIPVLKNGFYAVITLVAAFHAAMTILYNTPPNPVKTLTNLQSEYIGQFFYQDWGLFAPTPINMDINLLLECLSKDGFSSGPLDVSGELVKLHQQNRFTPYERLLRVPDNYAHSLVSRNRSEEVSTNLCKKEPNGKGCKDESEQRKLREESAKRGLTRVANAFCADMSASRYQKTFQKAHAWISLSFVPKWSKRNTSKKETKLVEGGMLSLAPTPAYGIWR